MDSANKVYFDKNGIIVIEVIGNQTVLSIDNMGEQITKLIAERRAQGKPVLILDNLLHIGTVDGEGRKKVVDLSKTLDYDKTAMLGKGGIMLFGTRLMLQATGRSNKIKYYDNLAEAMNWLLA